MASSPIVTVGLCVKNGAQTIKTAITSLCCQTYPAQKTGLLVIDGNSQDGTLKIIKENLTADFGSVRFLTETSGLGIARQMVIEQALGKYIIWLDADITLAPTYIQNQVAYMEQHPNVGIAAGKYNVHIGYGLAADLENIVYAVDSVYGQKGNASKFGYLPGAEGAIYRIEAVRGVGGFDTQINGAAEDTEIAYRVRAKGWQLATTQETFTEATRANWHSLWKQYVWYGKGGHYIFHKDPDSLNLIKMSPIGGFIAGILRSPCAYLLTHNTAFFLLPFHYTYKRLAWLIGFCDAHLSGYGHNINYVGRTFQKTKSSNKRPFRSLFKMFLCYMGMYAPSQSLRVKMYRWAGIKIGLPFVFSSHVFMDVMFPDITIGDDGILAEYDYVLSH